MLGALAAKLAPLLRGRVAVVTGAGVSAESGIPTFRGAGGYWRTHDARRLATREAFERDPALVWEWYEERRAAVRSASPNPAHAAIARLADISREHLVITQNVDDLHERGGTRADRLVHVHGEIFRTTCLGCDFTTSEVVPSVAPPILPPKCPRCRALLRPGVVWFGETLDRAQIERVEDFFARGDCDLVMTIGTTAVFDYVKDWSTRGGTLVEINPDPTPLSAEAAHVVRAPAGQVLPVLLGLAPAPSSSR